MNSRLRQILSNPIAKNLKASAVYKVFNIISQYLIITWALQIMDAKHYGVWITLSSIMSFISFFDFGIGNGLKNKLTEALVDEDFGLMRMLISTTYITLSFITLGLLLIGIPTIYLVDNWSFIFSDFPTRDSSITIALLICFSSVVFRLLFQNINNIYSALQKTFKFDQSLFISNVIICFVILMLKILGYRSFLIPLFAFTYSAIFVFAVQTILFFRKHPELSLAINAFNTEHIRGILNLGGKFIFLQINFIVLTNIPVVALSSRYGSSDVTDFNILYKLYSIPYMAIIFILVPFWPAFTKAKAENNQKWIQSNIKKLILLSMIMVVGVYLIFILDSTLMKYWLGSERRIELSFRLSTLLLVISYILVTPLNYIFNGLSDVSLQLKLGLFNSFVLIVLYTQNIYKLSGFQVVAIPGIFLFLNYIVYLIYVSKKYLKVSTIIRTSV